MRNIVRKVRLDTGMGITELAKRAKTTRQTIHAIEENPEKNISGPLMLNISAALHKPVEQIFFNDVVIHEEHSTA